MSEPKYLYIENKLKEEIYQGKFKYGDIFYSEKELAQKFDVSSITVIRAVKDLVAQGYLIRYQGKGTFVSHSPNNHLVQYQDITSYPELFQDADNEETMEVLDLAKENNPLISAKLKIPETNYYYHLQQLRKVDNRPFMFYNIYVPTHLIGEKNAQNKDKLKNIYLTIEEETRLYLLDEPFKETYAVVPANKEVAQTLGIKEGEKVIRQERTIVSQKTAEVLLYMCNYKLTDYEVVSLTSPDYPEE